MIYEIPASEAGIFIAGDAALLDGLSFAPPAGEPYYMRLMTPHRRPYATADRHLCVHYNDKQ